MALIRPGGIVGQISGRIGGNVYSHNRYGSYIRNGTIPVTSTTSYALAAKARMTGGTQAWQLLTPGERLAWNEWAAQNPVVNRLGQSVLLTGHAAFVGPFCRLVAAGAATITTPPLVPAPPPLLTCSLVADLVTEGFLLTFTATPLDTNNVLWIEACVVDSTGINYIENLIRFVGVSAAAQASTFDPLTLIEARFGTLEVDNIVQLKVSVFNTLTGLLSAPLRCGDTVVDTTV